MPRDAVEHSRDLNKDELERAWSRIVRLDIQAIVGISRGELARIVNGHPDYSDAEGRMAAGLIYLRGELLKDTEPGAAGVDEAGARKLYEMLEHLCDFPTRGFDDRGEETQRAFLNAFRFARAFGSAT
jgi:hypothetical protein